jgi:DNA (cytosine-5)-methyltransferase 1
MATVLGGLGDLGYGWAYRVLDARWFGVPQRRRRVFIVGCLGDAARAAAVLAVCESCGGHPAQGRETWEDVAPTLDDGARRSSVELPMIVDEQNAAAVAEVGALSSGSAHGNRGFSVAATLSSDGHPESNLPGRHHEDDDNLVVARSLTARNERIDAETENLVLAGSDTASQGHHGHSSPRGDGADNLVYALRRDAEQSGEAKTLSRDASGNMRLRDPGFNVYTDAPTVDATGPHTIGPVAGFYSHRGQNHDTAYTEDGCPPILGSQTAPGVNGPMGVRRLTPLECERLQGWPDEHTRWTADGKEIKDSHRYRLIGNGVASPVAEYIAHRLVEADRWP